MGDFLKTAPWLIGDPMKKEWLDKLLNNTNYLNQRSAPLIDLNFGTDNTSSLNIDSATWVPFPIISSDTLINGNNLVGCNKLFFDIAYNTVYGDAAKKGYIRLYNVTDSSVVTGSEIELDPTASGSTWLLVRKPDSSANYFSLPAAFKRYRLEAKVNPGAGTQYLRLSRILLRTYPE